MTQESLGTALRRLQTAWTRHRTMAMLAGSGLACAFAILSSTHCRFIITNSGSLQQASAGLFSKPFYNEHGERLGCIAYSSMEWERSTGGFGGAMFVTARAFAVMAALFSGISTICMAAVVVFKPPEWSAFCWSSAKSLLAGAAACQMLTIFVLGDSEKCGPAGCRLAGVGVLAVFNTLLLAALSISFIFLPLPSIPWLEFRNHDNSVGATESRKDAPHLRVSEVLDHQEDEEDGQSIISSNTSHHFNSSRRSEQPVTSIQKLPSFRLLSVALIFVACAVSVVGVNRCTFLSIGSRQGEALTSSVFFGKGLFSQAINDINGDFLGCVAFSAQTVSEFDTAFRTGRAFGAITTLLLTTVLVLATVQLFCHTAMRLRIWYSFRIFLPVITISQLITFTAFGSNICHGVAECRPGGTGIAVILNVFLLLALTTLVCLVSPPMRPVFQRVRAPPVIRHEIPREPIHVQPMPEILTDPRMEHLEGPIGLTDDDTDTEELYYNWHAKPREMPVVDEHDAPAAPGDDVESIEVKVVYTETEKKTIKTINHKDGSKTITTVVEEMESDYSSEDEEIDDHSDGSVSVY